ncbi:ABC transporter permease [Sphingobacterium sp. UT-1RO-CII-1]|uniref:ABC transporter permease n=1 Tax=Sphingobacterium sp. UT-1RO-CII-1 TaxID=2995225 RepID=UPI00227D5501|nr:ABC transporter permease [Sphingobacterium sp. UT-1RO-CII-1]MCY4778073.1 ABC transporter permease [Sphingobacterium sp. UT-1RO-CII-1]
MVRNHIKIAWRNLWKNSSFTLINIIGLAIGMGAVLIIALWVKSQWQYDRFYSNSQDIYKVWNHYKDEQAVTVHDITAGAVAKSLADEYPEVLHTARLYWSSSDLLSYNGKHIKSTGNSTDKSFLEIFDFPLLKGERSTVLAEENNIVLTESLAKSLFGKTDPIGKIVTLNNKDPYLVSGVVKDLPGNTTFDFNFLIRISQADEQLYSDWNTNTFYTYVKLQENTNTEQFNKKLSSFLKKYVPGKDHSKLFLYPMSKMHLYGNFENGIPSGGKIEQVQLVAGIGALIILIACINFVNLSTARAQRRAKEVGVRKVIGAGRKSLIAQFLTESVLLASISGAVAILISFVALPLFNQLLDTPIALDFFNLPFFLLLIACILLTGLLAGIYPAFVLSAFDPSKTLKGLTLKNKWGFNLRQSLVVVQFSIALMLIIATIIVRMQIVHGINRDIGYETSNLIEIQAEGNADKNFEAIKTELLQNQAAEEVTRTGWTITGDYSSAGGGYRWEGSTPEQEKNMGFRLYRAESNFIRTYGLQLIDGRDIDYARLAADSTAILLNESAIKAMQIDQPIGKIIYRNEQEYTIVGVFNDFILGSPYEPIRPMLINASHNFLFNIAIRLNTHQDRKENLQAIEQVFKKFNPQYPFNYRFVDELHQHKFKGEKQMATLAMTFSILAIFVSCLGLFGLSAYMAETRSKEIGIRKVLGASIAGVIVMLSKDYIKLVTLALVIGSPLAWWAMNKWLNDFTYRINIPIWIFIVAGTVAITIALLTVGTQALRAARANPVDSLRDE